LPTASSTSGRNSSSRDARAVARRGHRGHARSTSAAIVSPIAAMSGSIAGGASTGGISAIAFDHLTSAGMSAVALAKADSASAPSLGTGNIAARPRRALHRSTAEHRRP
jgi:hypothetical protein